MTTDTTPKKFLEVKHLNLPQIDAEILKFWSDNLIFEKSIEQRSHNNSFVFYEGPPSVNGLPGIHHVVGRTIKDIFCRYKSLKGYKVLRKAGWDTHGLPIELAVEKKLGIKKIDIGTKISVEDYNKACRNEAMQYIEIWNDLTQKMGYWVDLNNPYKTYDTNYIETVWHLISQLHQKDYLYKGYTIQPYSPAAGTGLSNHELNQPGTYVEVKDTSAVAQFKIINNEKSAFLFQKINTPSLYFLAWTTTPWTLPSNTALAVGKNIQYAIVQTFNAYTFLPITVILAKDLLPNFFKPEAENIALETYQPNDKLIPYKILHTLKGTELQNIEYEQLLPYVQPELTKGLTAFKVVIGDFVTTADGTGIVHIAPSFGADDMRMSKIYNLATLTLVDKQGRFVAEVTDFANRPVKNYDNVPEKEYISVDIDICIKLKKENKAFKVEKYAHNYPHCYRTDKPIIYYPLDSWFIKTTAAKERLIELNKTINWIPESTGTGRFGNWLENLVDWNLSRSRFWGIPLPVWRTATNSHEICIGSIEQLNTEIKKAMQAKIMTENPYENAQSLSDIDLHRPYIDKVVLVAPNGEPMYREPDLIDVWFDSGAMPYAQHHYPFRLNNNNLKNVFPADFIAEGVDQTRGWFFTLHAIAVMLFDSVAYKTVLSNGLLLDKNGVKMSKRLGNVINPTDTIRQYGADATRWYIINNNSPWENTRFDVEGIDETRRKLFGTLFNTYSFFTIYANTDGFTHSEAYIPLTQRPEIDRWIISTLNSLTATCDQLYAQYDATRATRLIQNFVCDHLSNWYVRLCRRRFWKGEYEADKVAAYQTLYECLVTVCQLMSPVAPFITDFIFKNLNTTTNLLPQSSIHLTNFPASNPQAIDEALEERMQMAQDLSSLVLALRKKLNIKVRQPLQKMLVPVLNPAQKQQIEQVKDLILSEVNVKELQYIDDTSGLLRKSIKPDFKQLGKKYGQHMKAITETFAQFSQADITQLEKTGQTTLTINNEPLTILLSETLITSTEVEGWQVQSLNGLTVALDVQITESLKNEGIVRELVNRIQNIRKETNLNLTDRIALTLQNNPEISPAVQQFNSYICTETLAQHLHLQDAPPPPTAHTIEVNEVTLWIVVEK